MRKAILMLLLAIMSNSAMAEWVGINSNDEFTYYANPASIQKSSSNAKIWIMFDYKDAQASEETGRYYFMSVKQQNEFDCKASDMKKNSFSMYSQNMGAGKLVYTSSKPTEWEPIVPDSINEYLWKVVCTPKEADADLVFSFNFKCPESLPTNKAREKGLKEFWGWILKNHKDWSLDKALAFRYDLLVNHLCEQTIANINASPQDR